jgi:hypothetical protein
MHYSYTIKGVRLYAVKMAIIVLLGKFRIKTLFLFSFFCSPSSLYSLFKMRVM